MFFLLFRKFFSQNLQECIKELNEKINARDQEILVS